MRRGRTRRRATLAAAAAAGLGLLACAPDPAPDPDAPAEVARESRFRITLESRSPESPGARGRLRLHVEPRGDWHVAPEAPAWLSLEPAPDLAFDAAERLAPETAPSEQALVFASGFRASRAGDHRARGRVKFGLCEGDDEACVIVERELELPLAVAFRSGAE